MPRWMRQFLIHKPLHQHFRLALVGAIVLRVLCAFFVYGPQALDDYKHGVWPAYQYFAGLPVDLPDYRSHLLMWVLAAFIRLGSWAGFHSAVAQVRVMYMGLAGLSLLGLWGTYFYVQSFRSRLFAALTIYLVALFPLMPFISTRAFGESIAMSFVLLGFGLLERARRESRRSFGLWFLGFCALGVACLFRFHAGLLFLSYLAVLLWIGPRRGVVAGIAAGLCTLGAQYGIDWWSAKPPFGTLVSYLAENEGGAAQYGVSPWYNTWLFVLALSLAPFSLVFIKKCRGLWRVHWPWLVPFLIYVLAHSLVPHKEERFLYPIVGLELWAVGWLWASSALFAPSRRIFSVAFGVLCLPLLVIVCFVNSQEGEIEPPAYAESHFGHVVYLDHQSLFAASRFQFYFLRPPSLLRSVEKESFNVRAIDDALVGEPESRAVVLLTSVPDARDQLHALEGIRTMYGQCHNMRTAGSMVDRLLYGLNPKHNERRRPTWYLICERGR